MIHIVIHILPQEIDQLEALLIQLKRNSVHLPKDHGIKVEVYLNCNFVDPINSTLPIKFFVGRFQRLIKLTASWSENCMFTYLEPSNFMGCNRINGCNDVRREVVRHTELPFIMYLDPDCVFSETFLSNMLFTCKCLAGRDYTVITPQTTRMWDSTWDPITNERYLTEEASHAVYDVRDPYEAVVIPEGSTLSCKEIDGFKFAGWGTTISTKLARLIDIPDSLGSYGLDDTFIMTGCQLMKQKGYDVKQFVIINELIIENNLFRTNPYKDYLVTIDRRDEFLAQAHAAFPLELIKLHERIPAI